MQMAASQQADLGVSRVPILRYVREISESFDIVQPIAVPEKRRLGTAFGYPAAATAALIVGSSTKADM
ncbi:hypothetical protein EB230_31070 [Mesorhizobium sp. NZP2234]|nr:hypothetical protein EB230_31070 [Mesorhizobium sp. NZP2234]